KISHAPATSPLALTRLPPPLSAPTYFRLTTVLSVIGRAGPASEDSSPESCVPRSPAPHAHTASTLAHASRDALRSSFEEMDMAPPGRSRGETQDACRQTPSDFRQHFSRAESSDRGDRPQR